MVQSPFEFQYQDDKNSARQAAYHSLGQAVTNVFLLSPVGFGSLLVSNPVFALQWICILLAGLQVVIWLLKPASAGNGAARASDLLKKRAQIVFQSGGLMLASVIFYYIIAVLYGAPFTESTAETFHFSLLLSMLTTLPACLQLGPHLSAWARILIGKGPDGVMERHIYWTTLAAIVGAWFGSFPIPLDWDRPWQAWPITCCIGALLGSAVGNGGSSLFILYELRKTRKRKHV